ncbi:TetR/AcrR family transcriptional regulator [Streptococcus pantholopis]|uniref:HTH tetR-type domain-containing protein n=1 Tax=Streptococcus pantholopis TaxID=1811193 RepID=A0A172Q6I4_9STRE|nr:TetR/AcrR family transcriptional regulator [Streptococcus pantholopis]AND79113.1 hypothetical protein A0O21_03270 [Streptococcus pantholopis]
MTDLRVLKTQKAIRESFINLVEEKGFLSLTVQDILNRALINRRTFYNYYMSKYHLADVMIAELVERYSALLDFSLGNRSQPLTVTQYADHMMNEFYDERRAILLLWNLPADHGDLYTQLRKLMKERFSAFLESKASDGDLVDFQAEMMLSIILSTFHYILEHNEHYTIVELNKQFQKLITNSFIPLGITPNKTE